MLSVALPFPRRWHEPSADKITMNDINKPIIKITFALLTFLPKYKKYGFGREERGHFRGNVSNR